MKTLRRLRIIEKLKVFNVFSPQGPKNIKNLKVFNDFQPGSKSLKTYWFSMIFGPRGLNIKRPTIIKKYWFFHGLQPGLKIIKNL